MPSPASELHQHRDRVRRAAGRHQPLALRRHGLRLRALGRAAPQPHRAAVAALGAGLGPPRSRPRPARSRGSACSRAAPRPRRRRKARLKSSSPPSAVAVTRSCSAHSRVSSVVWAKVASWRSSTRMWRNRSAVRSRTCGLSCSSRNVRSTRSPESSAPRSPSRASWSAYTRANSSSRARRLRSASVSSGSASASAATCSWPVISAFSRSMRETKPASSGAGFPRISCRRRLRSSIDSSSSATRSARLTAAKSGARPASSASSRSSRSQKELNVCTCSSS